MSRTGQPSMMQIRARRACDCHTPLTVCHVVGLRASAITRSLWPLTAITRSTLAFDSNHALTLAFDMCY